MGFLKNLFSTETDEEGGRFLDKVKVLDTAQGKMITLSHLWRNETVLLKIFRRFGCPLLRYECMLLSELHKDLELDGVKFVGVGFDDYGLKDFVAGNYWSGDILIDSQRTVYQALNLNRMKVSKGLRDLLAPVTRTAIAAAYANDIYGDAKEDGFQLGATFVIGKSNRKVAYDHRQAGIAHFPSLKGVFQACGGDPSTISERVPDECLLFNTFRTKIKL